MQIYHDNANNRAFVEIEGFEAEVEYRLGDGYCDITHTFVPSPLEGRGIASQLVKFVYDYARNEGLKPRATCPYAKAWLDKHPEYKR